MGSYLPRYDRACGVIRFRWVVWNNRNQVLTFVRWSGTDFYMLQWVLRRFGRGAYLQVGLCSFVDKRVLW